MRGLWIFALALLLPPLVPAQEALRASIAGQDAAEARKRAKKIQDGAQVMIDELNSIEDDIELMTRAIDNKKR